jgi:hypothetical protein
VCGEFKNEKNGFSAVFFDIGSTKETEKHDNRKNDRDEGNGSHCFYSPF